MATTPSVTPYVQMAQNFAGQVLGFTQRAGASTAQSAITKIHAEIAKHGVARNNRFFVKITTPPIMGLPAGHNILEMYCDSASLPGVSLARSDSRRYGVGPTDYRPHAAIYSDMDLGFIGDAEGKIYRFFYKWLNNIVNFSSPSVTTRLSSLSGPTFMPPHRVGYKSDYSTTVEIITYNESNDQVLKTTLYKAFPWQLGQIGLNWGDDNSLQRIPVIFSFSNWSTEEILFGTTAQEANPWAGFQKIIKAGTAIQVIRSIKKPQSVGDVINIVNNAKVILENF